LRGLYEDSAMKFGTKVEIFSQDTANIGQGNNNANEHDVN